MTLTVTVPASPVSGETILGGLGLTGRERVLVLGGYGVGNVGDEAILAGLLAQMPPVSSIRVVSRNPPQTTALHGVEAVSPVATPPALAASDVLIVGGGGIFSSDTGPFGRFIPLVCRLARLRGVRVVFHGLGVYSSAQPRLLRSLVKLAPSLEAFSVRDGTSAKVLGSVGLAVQRIADLSESMSAANEGATRSLLASFDLDPARPTVALCLTRLNEPLGRFLDLAVPELVASLPDLQFCFLPISQHPTTQRHNDLNLARSLAGRCPELRIIGGEHHPSLVLGLFRHFSAAVCVRFHSYVFASRMGAPIVALPYAEKCDGWLAEHAMSGVAWRTEALVAAVTAAIDTTKVRGAA